MVCNLWKITQLDDANLWLLRAATLSLVTMAVHIFLAGLETVGPLLSAKDLASIPRATAYYCWHIVTITIGAMGAAFAMSAMTGTPDAAIIATFMAAGFTIWNVALIISHKLPWLQMGQWALFGTITILGIIGLV
jgi:hypothetical protein